MSKHLKWALPVLALMGVLAFVVSADPPGVGTTPPEVSGPMLDGETLEAADLEDKVVLLDFWATWCPPCRAALPHTQKLSKHEAVEAGDLVVLAVNAREEAGTVQAFMEDNEYDFDVLMDDGALMEAYGVEGIPTFVVIGKDGKVAWQTVGFGGEQTANDMDAAIEAALAD